MTFVIVILKVIVKARRCPSNENLFCQVQIYLQFEAEYTTRERSKRWAIIIQEETGLVKDREYCFTDIAFSPKLYIFLEVQTDAVVVQVAKKYAVIQVIDESE